ncbi:MAG: hypothetical protein AB8G05_28470 [Oligoflexales bacterium]
MFKKNRIIFFILLFFGNGASFATNSEDLKDLHKRSIVLRVIEEKIIGDITITTPFREYTEDVPDSNIFYNQEIGVTLDLEALEEVRQEQSKKYKREKPMRVFRSAVASVFALGFGFLIATCPDTDMATSIFCASLFGASSAFFANEGIMYYIEDCPLNNDRFIKVPEKGSVQYSLTREEFQKITGMVVWI